MTEDSVQVRLNGRAVADYVARPELDSRLSPRPYLHPVRTLAGVLVSELMPEDHPHHLGVSVAVQDVDKTNLWGGRTYVRDAGYTWLDDHGRIIHDGFDALDAAGFVARARWCDASGGVLLTERLAVGARIVRSHPSAWVLDVLYTLTPPEGRTVTLGSPATNGRRGGSGYGGFFWRAPMQDPRPHVFTADADGEDAANGSTGPWVAMTTEAYGLVFTGLGDGDHWFVRSAGYPGVGAAIAYERPLEVTDRAPLTRRHIVAVADGRVEGELASTLAAECQGLAVRDPRVAPDTRAAS